MLSFLRNLSDGSRRWVFGFLLLISVGTVLNVWAWYVGSLLTPTSVVVVSNGQHFNNTATVSDAVATQSVVPSFSFFASVKGAVTVAFDAIVSIIK